jgi:TolB protein
VIRSTLALIGCILAIMVPAHSLSQSDFLRVTATGSQQLRLAIPPAIALGGAAQADLSRQISDILAFDLGMTGVIAVTTPESTAQQGIRPGEFNLSSWRPSADLLLKAGYLQTPEQVTVEFRLYDVTGNREILAKRYHAPPADLRRIVHTFADDTLQTLTGERGPFSARLAYVSKATGTKEIAIMDWDGYNSQKVTGNGSINLNPEFSPSGREIIFTSYKRQNPDLYRRELYTGNEARISASPGINITGAFAPDGNRIALAMSKDGNSEIYLLTKDGKQLSRLTNHPGIDLSPTWSPDGTRLAFVSDRLGKPQVFTMNQDGTDLQRLTRTGAYNVSPRWSPKGDKIAYCRQYGEGMQIHLINPDGSDDRQLTLTGSNEHPRWSPDGRFIVYSSKRNGKEAVFVMRADGSGQTKVSRADYSQTHPTWSPR